jgi:hydrogenase-1 operon protein HyaE
MNYQQQRAADFRDLLTRLAREAELPSIAAADLAERAAATPALAVLFTGDPTLSPESWDVCVVLPEMLEHCPGVSGCVLDPAQTALAAPAYGVGKLPALVLLRGGNYVGVLEGMRDWQPFVDELRRLSVAPPRPVPVAGIYTTTSDTARPA